MSSKTRKENHVSTTMMGLHLRLMAEKREKIYKWLLDGGGIGEEIDLRIDNGHFEIGTFKAKITEFITPYTPPRKGRNSLAL